MTPETKIETVSLGSLADKTMFLSLEFKRFGNSRQADVVIANTTADQDRFRHSKRLLESPELKPITKADNALRNYIDKQPAVWSYTTSTRCVGYEAVETVYEACENYQKITRPVLIKAFLDVYVQRVSEAAADLGSEFNAADYPTIDQVAAEFDFTFQLMSFSTPQNLSVISPKIFHAEKSKKVEMFKLAADVYTQGRRTLLNEMLSQLIAVVSPKTDGKKKRLRPETVTKLQEFLDTYNLNSVPEDAELQADITKIKALMAGVDADKIRESDNLKAAIATGFSDVKQHLDTLVTVTGRKIR